MKKFLRAVTFVAMVCLIATGCTNINDPTTLKEEQFVNIWQRVIRVSEISPLISPELPKEPEIIEITNIMDKISKIGSYEKEMAEHNYTVTKQN